MMDTGALLHFLGVSIHQSSEGHFHVLGETQFGLLGACKYE